MSFTTDDTREGIIVYKVFKAMTKAEAAKLMGDLEKSLGDGKSKIIIEMNSEAATGNHGYGYIEKAFRGLRILAVKLHGDIKYVLPPKISSRIAGTSGDVAAAVKSLSGATNEDEFREEHLKMREQLIFQESQIKKLTTEVNLLTKKTSEFAKIVGTPVTDSEMRSAIDHFRKLASEIQVPKKDDDDD